MDNKMFCYCVPGDGERHRLHSIRRMRKESGSCRNAGSAHICYKGSCAVATKLREEGKTVERG